ncbi:MAG: gluconeogenesis factor YvcK family protein [Armatimonadota bacterium]
MSFLTKAKIVLRLLLPGIRLKRWIFVSLSGIVFFAIGFSIVANRQWDPRITAYSIWYYLTSSSMSDQMMRLLGVVLLIGGLALVGIGTRRLIRAFTSLANPNATARQLVLAILDKSRATPRLRVVGIGGGTGLSNLLRGLKTYPVDLTAIVTVSDDGGSSGRLRNDLDMPPPGDIRNCLVALADAEPLMERLFLHRFTKTSNDLNGHSLGNLIIAGLREMHGDFQQAIKEASQVLAVRGRVLPSADRALVLRAVMDDGTVVEGETAIVARKGVITSIHIDPPDVSPLPEVLDALAEADVIIVGPGSVYSSLLPNLIIPGMAEALAASPAIKFFICNVMTQPGESDNFSASRHLEAVLEHLPCPNPFDYAVVNLQSPPPDVAALYAEKGQRFVEPDLARFRALGTEPVTGNLLAKIHLARHDPDELAHCILTKIAETTKVRNLLMKTE